MDAPTQDERDAAAQAIAHRLGFVDEDEIDCVEVTRYDHCRYDAGSTELLVLTDDEADDRAQTDIQDSLWAFNADFLASYMPNGIDAEEITAIRGDRCEDANDAMVALVQAGGHSLVDLAEAAIAADGRGHFLASYDGEENEVEIDGRTWYAYRT